MTLFVTYKGQEWVFEPSPNARVDQLIEHSLNHFRIQNNFDYHFRVGGEVLKDSSAIGMAPRSGHPDIVRVELVRTTGER